VNFLQSLKDEKVYFKLQSLRLVDIENNFTIINTNSIITLQVKLIFNIIIIIIIIIINRGLRISNEFRSRYEGWNFNSGNYLFTTDTK